MTENLDVAFVGFNPSLRSGETGHHYANPSNRFWRILHESGFTDRRLSPSEDGSLPRYRLGLTNIVERPTRAAADIKPEEYDEGRIVLRKKLRKYKPMAVCFVGKGVYEAYRATRNVPWGFQDEPLESETAEYVAPSSSGLVRMSIEEMVAFYTELRIWCEERGRTKP